MLAEILCGFLASDTTMALRVSKSDTGKRVVFDDRCIGWIAEVQEGTAYVELESNVPTGIKSRVGWGPAADEVRIYPLELHMIDDITDDEVRLTASH